MFKERLFNRSIAAAIIMALVLCLGACSAQNSDQPQESQQPEASIPPADISNTDEIFTKELEPLKYEDGEQMESPFYRVVNGDDGLSYEVQPKGEDETLFLPIDSVIYIVGSPEECKIEKVSFDYTPEDGETETIEQYRIYATSNTGGVLDSDDNAAASGGEKAPAVSGTKGKGAGSNSAPEKTQPAPDEAADLGN